MPGPPRPGPCSSSSCRPPASGRRPFCADSTAAAGLDLATGAADAAVLPFTSTPYPTQAIAWYTPLLGPPGHDGSENWSNFDDPTLNSLLTKAAQQLNPNTASPLYTQADALLWKQMVALPLFAEPSAMAWSAYTAGVGPNPNGANLLWSPRTGRSGSRRPARTPCPGAADPDAGGAGHGWTGPPRETAEVGGLTAPRRPRVASATR